MTNEQLIDSIICQLNTLTVAGVANMKIIMEAIQKLALLKDSIRKEYDANREEIERLEGEALPAIRTVAIDNEHVTPDAKVGQSIFDATGIGQKNILRAIRE